MSAPEEPAIHGGLMMEQVTILWKRIDQPGAESARLVEQPGGWQISGTAVFAYQGRPCRLNYQIDCTANWETRSAWVVGWVGAKAVDVRVSVDGERRWRVNGVEVPSVEGCIDIDLNFSPSTNLLPIRRLGLAVGQEHAVQAAWLRFPEFMLEPLEQTYRRMEENRYRYESGGEFVREISVTTTGFAILYPDYWEMLALL
jgi:uncharacterized protein